MFKIRCILISLTIIISGFEDSLLISRSLPQGEPTLLRFLGLVGGSRCEPEEEIPIFFGSLGSKRYQPSILGAVPKDNRLIDDHIWGQL